MKKCWMLLLGLCGCLATLATATQTSKSGTISASQAWADTINVTGSITISAGTVTVRPGTRVRFMSNYSINVSGKGNITAVGTAESTIIFTSGLSSPARGSWSKILFRDGMTQSTQTAFAYCSFLYGGTPTEFRTYTGAETSTVTFTNCTYRTSTGAGIYITGGWKVIVNGCSFQNMAGPAIFSHPASRLEVRSCLMDSCVTGVCCASGLTPFSTIIVDHATIYDIDLRMAGTNYQPWNGTGINTTNASPGGRLTITNSIVQKTMNYGFNAAAGWTIIEDYNCWFNNRPTTTDASSLGAHSLDEIDPLLADVLARDFRLTTGSPCLGAASDGTHLGWSQEVVTTGIAGTRTTDVRPIVPRVGPNPFVERVVFSLDGTSSFTLGIFNLDGTPVKAPGVDMQHATWDGIDEKGCRVKPGVYVYRLSVDGQKLQGRVLRAK
jgi:hypothetical protein